MDEIIHILPKSSRNTSRFISFLRKHNLLTNQHWFVIVGNGQVEIGLDDRVSFYSATSIGGLFKTLLGCRSSTKVVVHGLFSPAVIVSIALLPRQHIRKVYWVIWGGDLYATPPSLARPKRWILYQLRARAITRISNVITYIPGDVEQLRERFGANPRVLWCLMYPGNLYKAPTESAYVRSGVTDVNIMVGNSGSPENRHLSVFQRLAKNPRFTGNVYCPLSYGDEAYIKTVIERGREYFGCRFLPITEYLDLADFVDLARGVDVAIYNYERQQGMGSIITMLGLNKAVFINSSTTPWSLFRDLGITVFDTNELEYAELENPVGPTNNTIIQEVFSERKLREQWEEIFSE